MGKKKTVIAVIITALITCPLTLYAEKIIKTVSIIVNGTGYAEKSQIIEAMLEENYLYDFDKKKANENAAKAYVASLGEPYTNYYTADEFSHYIGAIKESYLGVGLTVAASEDNKILIVDVNENGPSYAVGIKAGDIIKAIDETAYSGDALDDAVAYMKTGDRGSMVEITVDRDGAELSFNVAREEIITNSVSAEMLEDGIGYMRITSFNMKSDSGEESTYTEFCRELAKLKSSGMQKLVIDLRDNPGGVLEEVCDVADALLPEGVIMYTENKNGERVYHNSKDGYENLPIAVLINGNSASAAEVLTGALKDYERAVIVGTKSFGKGIVQNVFTFDDGSGISITTERYYTPNGVCIHETGITPDIIAEPEEEYKDLPIELIPGEDDTQLREAVAALKER